MTLTKPRTPQLLLSQSDVLSIASSIIKTYQSITSAYLFGSYAKGTARPNSDVEIALFLPDLHRDKLIDIGGVLMDLERAFDRHVDLTVCLPDDFVEDYWVPISLDAKCEDGIGVDTEPRVPQLVLSQSDVLSMASSVIKAYPSITSAYLFGSYAKGTARSKSDVDIAIFLPDLRRDKLIDIGGVLEDLERVLDKKIDLSVCSPDDFVEKIKKYWVPISLLCDESGTSGSGASSTETGADQSEDRIGVDASIEKI